MKQRKLFIFLVLSLLLFLSNAQSQTFNGGFMIGPTICDVDGADRTDMDNDFHKIGLSAGALVNMKVGHYSLFQMELAYIMKGSAVGADSTHTNEYYNLSMDYVDVSLLYRQPVVFTLNKKRITNFGIEAGVTAGALVRSVLSIRSISYAVPSNKIDLSVLGGLFYDFGSHFFLEFRYSNSLIHAIKHNASNNPWIFYTWNKGNNMVFQITLGYVINSRKKQFVEE